MADYSLSSQAYRAPLGYTAKPMSAFENLRFQSDGDVASRECNVITFASSSPLADHSISIIRWWSRHKHTNVPTVSHRHVDSQQNECRSGVIVATSVKHSRVCIPFASHMTRIRCLVDKHVKVRFSRRKDEMDP